MNRIPCSSRVRMLFRQSTKEGLNRPTRASLRAPHFVGSIKRVPPAKSLPDRTLNPIAAESEIGRKRP
jgi:hypothetical protein